MASPFLMAQILRAKARKRAKEAAKSHQHKADRAHLLWWKAYRRQQKKEREKRKHD